MAPFSAFPSEILSLILEYLSDRRDLYACLVMNKQLYQIAQPLLWRTPQLHNETAADQFYTGLTMTSCYPASPLTSHLDPNFGVGPWIRKLKLHDAYWTDPRLLVLMKHIPNLEDLYLTHTTELTEESLALLPQHCTKLKTLRLFGVPGITPLFMDALGQCCHQISTLTIHECNGLDGHTYEALQYCRLQTLTIGMPPQPLQSNTAMWNLIIHHPWLTTLSLNFCQQSFFDSSSNYRFVDDRFMRRLFTEAVDAWPYLTTLSIGNYIMMVPFRRYGGGGDRPMDDPLVTFLQHHSWLQKLYLREIRFQNNHQKNMCGLANVVLPYLTQLTITDSLDLCSRELEHWILMCPQLTFVCFWGSPITPPMDGATVMSCGSREHYRPRYNGPFLHHLDQEDIFKLRFGCT